MLIKRRLKKTLTVFGQPIAAKQQYKIKPAAKPQAKLPTENGQPKPKKPATKRSKKATPACKKVKVKKPLQKPRSVRKPKVHNIINKER